MVTFLNFIYVIAIIAAIVYLVMIKTHRVHLHYHPYHPAAKRSVEYWMKTIVPIAVVFTIVIGNAYTVNYQFSFWHAFCFIFFLVFFFYMWRVYKKLRKDYESTHGRDKHAPFAGIEETWAAIGWGGLIAAGWFLVPIYEWLWHWIHNQAWNYWVWLNHGREHL